jgi:hypothetical protein
LWFFHLKKPNDSLSVSCSASSNASQLPLLACLLLLLLFATVRALHHDSVVQHRRTNAARKSKSQEWNACPQCGQQLKHHPQKREREKKGKKIGGEE